MTIQIRPSDTADRRALIDYLNARLPELVPDNRYSLEAILGPDIWADTDVSHHALGRYFADMVSRGHVPFVMAGWTSDRHNRYKYTA
jgi:hypothetical protein